MLHLLSHSPGSVFGTGPSDVFASAYSVTERKNKMYHYNGTTWTLQELPAEVGEGGVSDIVGEAGNVYAFAGWSNTPILRYDGITWQIVKRVPGLSTMVYISSNEIYAVHCYGHWLWDGSEWRSFPGFDF